MSCSQRVGEMRAAHGRHKKKKTRTRRHVFFKNRPSPSMKRLSACCQKPRHARVPEAQKVRTLRAREVSIAAGPGEFAYHCQQTGSNDERVGGDRCLRREADARVSDHARLGGRAAGPRQGALHTDDGGRAEAVPPRALCATRATHPARLAGPGRASGALATRTSDRRRWPTRSSRSRSRSASSHGC